jgi:AraC-like DNA-binding protein
MLTRYLECRSRDLNEIEAAFTANANGERIDLPGGQPTSEFIANAARFDDGELIFARYDSPITLRFHGVDCIRLLYPTDKASTVVVDGQAMENGPSRPGCLVNDNRPSRGHHADGLQQLSLRIPTATLRRKLAALLGSDGAVLDLRQPSAADPRRAECLRAAVFRFANELDIADARFLPSLVTSSIDKLCLDILTCLDSDAGRRPAAPSAVQLGQVEQYLVAHYAEPLTVETLAAISGIGAASVLGYFHARYQCSPQQYLERVRVEMAHLKLRLFPTSETVESIALQCGFPSPRAFRLAYQKKFGVPPAPKTARR